MSETVHDRTLALIGATGLERLKASTVCVLGVGGVGSYAIEGLARAGIGSLVIVDPAKVDVTNINRQIIALHSTVGRYKVEVSGERIHDINPEIRVTAHSVCACRGNLPGMIPESCGYIIDAMDSVAAKVDVALYARDNGIPLISCMGTGNKLDPAGFLITDISATKVCPLAKKMRTELKKAGIDKLTVLYSEELPKGKRDQCISSISFVPASAGLRLAGHVIRSLLGIAEGDV
ncbi:MAG: tRNA threonylcarbamoyladenosine dehydratase [Clostridia bacterium]